MSKLLTAPISVIIPCFRCALTIKRAVDSVLSQNLLPFEIILVDDCSQDGTLAMLQILEQAHPDQVKIVKMVINKGAASARNAGWAAATQPYIAFLDADDAWHSRKIEIQYAYMIENSDVVLCGHGYRQLQLNALPDWNVIHSNARQIKKWDLILSNRFVTPSVMVRRDIEQRFLEDQRYMEDHMLWLEIICNGGHVSKITSELAAIYKYSFGVKGLSSQLWLMERGDLGNYRRLYNTKYINGCQFYALCSYSLLKYIRRLFIYCIYHWRRGK